MGQTLGRIRIWRRTFKDGPERVQLQRAVHHAEEQPGGAHPAAHGRPQPRPRAHAQLWRQARPRPQEAAGLHAGGQGIQSRSLNIPWNGIGSANVSNRGCVNPTVRERPLPDVKVLERRPQAEPRDPLAVHQGDGEGEPGLARQVQVPPHLGPGRDHLPGLLRGRRHSGTDADGAQNSGIA